MPTIRVSSARCRPFSIATGLRATPGVWADQEETAEILPPPWMIQPLWHVGDEFMAARGKGSLSKDKRYPWLKVPTPAVRALQVYAIDPSSGRYADNCSTVHVPWEKLDPGPTGRKIGVIDYDAANKRYYPPVDLDDPLLLATDGLSPSESDPRFHQQMVYAITSRTIQMFETALGRDIHWRRADRFGKSKEEGDTFRKKDDIRVLKLYPHAMQQANAY